LLLCTSLWGCPGRYDSAPAAEQKETEAMKERYQALIAEAKKLAPGQELDLLHHFSSAVLSQTKPETFQQLAAKFIADVKAGKLDQLEITGGRAPGKVRLLLLATSEAKGAIPFVKGAEGWKLDDVEAALGKYDKELDIKGTAPAAKPSPLAALAVFQDAQSAALDRVLAALDLAVAGDRATAEKYSEAEKDAWARTALHYAAWKGGAACEPFAQAFPIDGKKQQKMYDNDSDAYRTLLKGLTECAGKSGRLEPVMQVYLGCSKVEAGPRSEYVDPVVEMANAQPELVLQAALKAKIDYDQDPVANILVGALHGEQKSAFYQFVGKHASGRSATARLAKDWVDKMAERDKLEPPGTEGGATP
jgi:hypothetical protein